MIYPIEFEAQVIREQHKDLLRDAETYRLARGSARRRVWREAWTEIVCRVPLPVLDPVCALHPSS